MEKPDTGLLPRIWKKASLMTEPHNSQRKQIEENWMDIAWCGDSFFQTLHYDDSQECKERSFVDTPTVGNTWL